MLNNKRSLGGHLTAALTVVVWGATFVASKHMLSLWTPVQVMCMRFALGYVTLWCMYPRWEKLVWREELRYLFMGISGCSVYFLCENGALQRTYAANVSILVATAPIFTALLVLLFVKRERPGLRLWLGFLCAMAGVALVVFNGTVRLRLSPAGDLLSLGAAVCWGVYSILQNRALQNRGSILVARKVAFYGLLTGLPLLPGSGAFPLRPLLSWDMAGSLLFLGVVGSGVCYFSWNWAQRRLGVLRTGSYIFAIPFVTMMLSALLLGEPVTLMGAAGAVLIVLGVAASQ